MFTSANSTLIKARMRQIKADGVRLSPTGEPSYAEYDFEMDYSQWEFKTWINFHISRVVEIRGDQSNVEAVWELKGWIQEKIAEIAGRELKQGDIVQFSTRSAWYTLGNSEESAGIFNTIDYQKFNLVKTQKPRLARR